MGQAERFKITGEYRYTYGDYETLVEAKNICYSMAVRNAIESYKTFITSTTIIKDFQLIKDLIQTISSGYLEDIKIVEQSVVGRTVYCKIEGYIVPEIVDNVIKREINRALGKEQEGIDENEFVKILSVKSINRRIHIVYKALSGWADSIMITFYDDKGDPIGGDKERIESDLRRGEIRSMDFLITPEVKSYRVWLSK